MKVNDTMCGQLGGCNILIVRSNHDYDCLHIDNDNHNKTCTFITSNKVEHKYF